MQNSFVPNVPVVTVREFNKIVIRQYNYARESGKKFLNIMSYGKPGIGKTESLNSATKNVLNINYRNMRLGQIYPPDFKGNPRNTEINGKWYQDYSVPALLPQLERDGEDGILHLDELNMSDMIIAGMAQQLLDSFKIGSHKLPKGWMIVSSGNLRTHGAHVNELSMPNKGRMIHYNVQEDLDEWIQDYALKAKVHPLIISYLKENPNHFYVLPTSPLEAAYASPRSWSYASDMLYSGSHPSELAAAIGESVATSFETYYTLKDELPVWERVLNKDTTYNWTPTRLSLGVAAVMTGWAVTDHNNITIIGDFIEEKLGEDYLMLYISTLKVASYNALSDLSNKENLQLFAALAENTKYTQLFTKANNDYSDIKNATR